ncbi:hypothetical protein AA12717_2227 [Gluconacetobacter sacchari DSM 12717]|uniref:DUF4431 domain-containing protein n=2 Tax=Gluconacetobacter sacchari TaxID=92759 RepID=A0A7W4IDT2_9PROT|nr:hypothetical protein [Gluconacetobacter sacchari]MBB2160909.1 hypothetical protein [Gluconacetobacter sacchari]GBQ25986.1 hypothetical protein AA12717_2227 [Gluconacetobacter sacchari DSM 12717]
MKNFASVVLMGLVAAPAMAFGAPCWKQDQTVLLSGKITIESVAAQSDPKKDAYTYPLLHLEKKSCYSDSDYGSISDVRAVAVVSGYHQLHFQEGQHVSLTGAIEHTVTADQPPQALMLYMKN